MEDFVYKVGSESLKEWESRNNNPTSIILNGDITANDFLDLAAEFDYSKYTNITIDELEVHDYEYDNGYTCSFEEYLSYRVCEDAVQLFELLKIYLNTQTTKSFVVLDGCVFTSDKKTLVHIPEGQAVEVPPFVEEIGIAVCSGYEDMLEITFNDGLKSIGKWAFVGAGISKLDLPDTLVSLGEDCFLTADLEKVHLSNSLEAIPDGCFNLCSIEEITIPSSVRIIGNASLRGLIFVDEIDIPEGVERIGYDAIERMKRVSLPSTLTEIAPDFYYEECIDDPDFPPYITVHPDNKTFFSQKGSLYFRDSGKLALKSEFNGQQY